MDETRACEAERRGDALVAPGAFPRSYRLEVALTELEPIPDGARLSVHHGTSRIPARVVRIDDGVVKRGKHSPSQSKRLLQLIIARTERTFAAAGLPPAAWRSYDTNCPPERLSAAQRDRLVYGQLAATLAERLFADPPRNNRDMLIYLLGCCAEVAEGNDIGTSIIMKP